MTKHDRPDPEFIAGLQALGQRLRAMRGRVSQERLARAVGSSRSELSRIELGDKLVNPTLADSLDRFFGTDGDIRAERDALERSAHADLVVGQFRENWLHHFPASYVGAVWTRVTPHPRRVQARHVVWIRWGRWQRIAVLDSLPSGGEVLLYTKGDDGLSVPLFFTLKPAAALAHGLGEVVDAIDINQGWTWGEGP